MPITRWRQQAGGTKKMRTSTRDGLVDEAARLLERPGDDQHHGRGHEENRAQRNKKKRSKESLTSYRKPLRP